MRFPLDEQQRPAVVSLDEHVFLAAGAGSGKTRVLVERYLKALESSGWDPALPARVLAITFTEKAALQMRERILGRLKETADEQESSAERAKITALSREMESAPISTIHGFCSRLLREHAIEAGIDPRFRVPDEVSLHELRRETLDSLLREGNPDLVLLAGEFGWSKLADALESLRELRRSLGLAHVELAGEGADRIAEGLRELALTKLREGIAARIEALDAAFAGICSHLNGVHPLPKGEEQLAVARSVLATREPGSVDPGLPERLLESMKGFRTGGKEIDDGGALKKKWERLKKEIEGIRGAAGRLAPGMDGQAAELAAAAFRLLHLYSDGIAAECRRRSWLDFEDLQLRALALLDADPALARRIAKQYRHVMVDELQDSNQLQHRLVRSLVPEGTDPKQRSLFVVGDHRQSIYAFRNADVEVFRREMVLRDEVGELSQLSKNYRSHPALVDFFNALFPHGDFPPMDPERQVPASERHAPRAQLHLTLQPKGVPRAESRREAAASLAGCLKEAWDRGLPVGEGEKRRAMRWGDVAILVRSGSAITPLARALSEAGIPFEASGGREYWLRQELLDLEDLVAALDDPYRRLPLARALRGDLVGMTTADLLLVMPPTAPGERPARDAGDLLTRLGEAALGELGLSEDGLSRAERLLQLVKRFSGRLRRLPLRRLVAELVEASDFDLYAATKPRALKVLRNLRQLEELLAELEVGGRLSVGEWLDYMKRQRDVAPKREEAWVPEEGGSLLRILTIHAAKGLEFPIVVVADLDRDLSRQSRPGDLPSLRIDLDEEEDARSSRALLGVQLRDEEEKTPDAAWLWIEAENERRERAEAERLLYVAMTRAEDHLVLSGVMPLGDGDARDEVLSGEAGAERSFLGSVSRALARGASADLCPLRIAGEDEFLLPGSGVEREAESATAAEPDPSLWEPLVAELPAPERREIPVTSLALIESCPLRWVLERRLDAGGLLGVDQETWSPSESAGETGPGGRSFGTALHRVLEAWDFRAEPAVAFAAACPSDLSAAHRREAEKILIPLLGGEQPWSQRLRDGSRFRREEPFLLDLGDVVLSGQMDLVFEWNGMDILVDWKSDRIEGRTDIDGRMAHHQLQMAIYAHALSLAGRPVKQALLCFLRPGLFRQVDLSTRQLEWAANKARNLANLASETSRRAVGGAGPSEEPDRLQRPGSPPCSDCPFRGNFCPREYRVPALHR